jgi:hypothetical protein
MLGTYIPAESCCGIQCALGDAENYPVFEAAIATHYDA